MVKLTFFFLAFAALVAVGRCADSNTCEDAPGTIAEIACGVERFSTLCGAVVSAGLDGALNDIADATVWAPNNDAFAAISDVVEGLTIEQLTDVLLIHVAGGSIRAKDLACDGSVETLLPGNPIQTKCLSVVEASQVGLGQAAVGTTPTYLTTDIKACNGIIHEISEVMIPGAPTPAPTTKKSKKTKRL